MIIERHLRIGNYVVRNDSKEFVISEILGIAKNFEWQYLIDSQNSDGRHREAGWISAEKCDPIHLTPEWLERCGLKQFEDEYDDVKVWSKSLIEIALKEGKFYLHASCTDPYYNQCIGEPLIYVHQLQNLYFALTGEELKIEL